MKLLTSLLVLAFVESVTALAHATNLPEKQTDKATFVGQPVSLVVQPETIRLAGPRHAADSGNWAIQRWQ